MGVCSCIKKKGQTVAEQKQVILYVLESEQMGTSAKLRVIQHQTDITFKIIVERFCRSKNNFNELDNDITMKILFSLCQIRKKYNKIPPKTDDQIKNILSDNMNRLLLDVFQALKLYERQETDIFEKDYFRQRNKMLIRTFSLPETYKGDGQFEQLFNFMSLFETALNSEITKNEMLCTNEEQSSLNIPIIFSIYEQ